MERGAPPDGYRWTGRGMEMALVDPQHCPAGHPAQLVRRDHVRCAEHGGHNAWACSCGQQIYRHGGEYVGELDCVSPNYGQQRD